MSKSKDKEFTAADLKPLTEYTDGQFIDSYGAIVKHGSRIIIESTYGGYNGEAGEAFVEWDGKGGMYKYVRVDDWLKLRYNFNGIHKFKLIQ